MKRIDIFSDINYDDFKHVNQMLFDELNHLGYKVRFFERFYMHSLSFEVLKRLIKTKFNMKKTDKKTTSSSSKDSNIKRIINFPPSRFKVLNLLNYLLVKYQIKNIGEIAITFVPSPALNYLFNKYTNVIYYCVHDSISQKYDNFILAYEEKLVNISKFVFCDNYEVLKRFSNQNNITNIFEHKLKVKNFLVPAPVPNEFFSNINKKININYDFVYFGSLHKDIDYSIFRYLHNLGFSVICITSVNKYFEEIKDYVHYHPIITNYLDLVNLINQANYILLPYKNSVFMNTVTPAKINQSIALKKKIICTNEKLSSDYGLNYAYVKNDEWISTVMYKKLIDVEKYSIKNISKEIISMIND